jgi:hypothetical protein
MKTRKRRITIEDNRIDTSGGYRLNKDWGKWEAYTAALEAEDERSEAQKETETELLRLYDLVARLRRSGHKTESKEVLIKAYESLFRAHEVARSSPSLGDPRSSFGARWRMRREEGASSHSNHSSQLLVVAWRLLLRGSSVLGILLKSNCGGWPRTRGCNLDCYV